MVLNSNWRVCYHIDPHCSQFVRALPASAPTKLRVIHLLPMHILLKIPQESAPHRTTSRVCSNLHKSLLTLLILSKSGRAHHILLKEVIDISLGTATLERSLRLVHQFLHELWKLSARVFGSVLLGAQKLCWI